MKSLPHGGNIASIQTTFGHTDRPLRQAIHQIKGIQSDAEVLVGGSGAVNGGESGGFHRGFEPAAINTHDQRTLG